MKDYKKILEGVMNIINTTEKSDIGFVNICTYISENCPELKESEEERIRKGLIDFVNQYGDKFYGQISKEYAIAWLEKQGTPAKLSEEEQNRFAKGVLSSCALSFIDYLDAHKHEGKMCVSNGECEDIENAFHNAMWDRLHRYYCKYIEKQGEQKPSEWGDKDDLRYCIDYVRPQHPTHDNGSVNIRHYRIPSFVGDKGAESILSVILSFGAKIVALYRGNVREGKLDEWNTPFIVDKEDWYTEEWLKSIKDRVQPQNTWKPSDEMLEALDIAIRAGIQLGSWEERALRELQKQLIEL